MNAVDALTRPLEGTVVEVLPATGLAYVADADQGIWTLTRSTRCAQGLALGKLRSGQRLKLDIVQVGHAALVSHYAPSAD